MSLTPQIKRYVNARIRDTEIVSARTVDLSTEVTNTLAVANGGTGQATYTNGQLLIGNSTGNTLTKATLTAGSGISVTNGAGSITIAATGGGVTDGDKGDITVSSSGATWTIDTGAVTLGKIQQIAATRVLGNASAITNNVSELSLTNVLDMVGSAAHGDILFRGASTWSRLSAGTSGNVLQTNGSGADPSWVSAGGFDPWIYTKLTSDFTTANSTLTDITGLTFTPASSTMYEFEAVLMIRTGTATNNPRTGIAWPTAGVTDGVAFIQQTGSTTATLVYEAGNSAATIQIPAGALPGASASYPVFIKGVLNMTTGASGTFKLQMAAETAGTSMTVRAGSFFKYRSF